MKTKIRFPLLFFLTFFVLNICVGVYLIHDNSIDSIVYLLIMQVINIGVAYRLMELFFSLILKKESIPKVDELVDFPSVALLYVTRDDAIPELLAKLKDQTYKNCDIYVIDDSTENKYKKLIDGSGFKVIRREDRTTGNKAGSLNNWLSMYGYRYDYFVIADSDSAFEDDFIEKILKYAEHPSNKNVAIFQSKILPWNTKNGFSRIVGTIAPLSMYFNEKLGNRYSTILSWGHNNLHRNKMIMEINGFDENFVAEDYATGLNLIKKGYECKIVDVVSYEAVPETVQNYSKRYIRWAKQTIELLKFDTKGIPFNTKLHLFMGAYSYLIWIVLLFGMFMVVFGYNSSFNDFIILANFIISGQFINTPFLQPFMLIVFYILNFAFLRLPLAVKLGISIKDYFKSLLLYAAIGGYMMFPLIKEELKVIFGAKVQFDITLKKKYEHKLSLVKIINEMKYGFLFNMVLIIGLFKNPVFLVYNFVWLIPLVLSPIVIYLIQEETI